MANCARFTALAPPWVPGLAGCGGAGLGGAINLEELNVNASARPSWRRTQSLHRCMRSGGGGGACAATLSSDA
jgi:hypothetical protein